MRGVSKVSKGTAVAVVALVLTAGGQAWAQSASVTGAIGDETGARLPGAVVELTLAGESRRADADARGEYRFDGVPAGRAGSTSCW